MAGALLAAPRASKVRSWTANATRSGRSIQPTIEPITMWVAGPGALIVAKIHKIAERAGAKDRVRDKDAWTS